MSGLLRAHSFRLVNTMCLINAVTGDVDFHFNAESPFQILGVTFVA